MVFEIETKLRIQNIFFRKTKIDEMISRSKITTRRHSSEGKKCSVSALEKYDMQF
jgi:hypothetical protein